MAQHAFTVSTGEPVGMEGAGTAGVLWGGPKGRWGTRDRDEVGLILGGTARRLALVGPTVREGGGGLGDGGRVEGGSGGSGEVRGGGCAGGGGGVGCECNGEGRWERIRERGIPDEWSPSEVSDHSHRERAPVVWPVV